MTTLTQDQILQGKRTLAEFEGYEIKEIDGFFKVKHPIMRTMTESEMWIDTSCLCYHTSLDALWPVWRKFRSADTSGFADHQIHLYLHKREQVARAFMYDSIEKCFSLLVDAVSWYVAQKGGSHAV